MAISDKICPPDKLVDRVGSFSRPLVFTNGCFDIIHIGHVAYLEKAKSYGATLLVALNTDESVKRQGKGDDRPINGLGDRLILMAALGFVDIVTWFDEDTPIVPILETRPDILVKGGDWPVEAIVGAREVIGWGGQVFSIPFDYFRSTTTLLEKIRRSDGKSSL